ncbi:MAG: hypothetical protein ACRETQ_03685 [Gammaproteobacteria bacterium]
MSLHSDEVDRAWNKLGMVIKPGRDRWARFYYEGKWILSTRRSWGSGKLDGHVPDFIRQQMKLNEDQFRDLISCPLQLEGYVEILKSKGLIEAEKEKEESPKGAHTPKKR